MGLKIIDTRVSYIPNFVVYLNEDRTIHCLGPNKSDEIFYKDLCMMKKFINNLSEEDIQLLIKEIKNRASDVHDWTYSTIRFVKDSDEYNIVVYGKGFKVLYNNTVI